MRPKNRPEKPYTLQEVFDRIWQHFIVEKNPESVVFDESGMRSCKYGGCGCAIGACMTIDDAEYLDHKCYNIDIRSISRREPEIFTSYFQRRNISKLKSLQEIHDFCFDRIEEDLRYFARNNDLTIPS